MKALGDRPVQASSWPWASLPGGVWLSRLGLAGLLLFWAWVLWRWPVNLAAALLAGAVIGVAMLLRPGVALPLLAIAIPFGSLGNVDLGPASVGPQEVLLAGILVAWVVRQLARRSLILRWPALAGAALLLLATMMAAFLPASSLTMAAKELLKWLELVAAMILVVNMVDGLDVSLLVVGLLVAGAAEGLWGLYQFFTRTGPEGFLLMGRFMRAAGTFQQPNPYGGYLGLTLPLALGLLLTAWPGKRETANRNPLRALWLLAAVSGGLMFGGLIASWSRGAWLGAMAGLATVVIARGGNWLRATLYVALVGTLLCLLVFGRLPIPSALEQRFVDYAAEFTTLDVRNVEVTDSNFAILERTAHWQAALEMFAHHPWTGVGLGNYAVVYEHYALPRWQDALGHAHNYYLNIAAEAGLPGLLAYLVWIGAGFWVAWRAVRVSRGFQQGIALGALGMWVHLSVHNIFDNLYVHAMGIQVGLLLGLAAWVVAESRAKPGQATSSETKPQGEASNGWR